MKSHHKNTQNSTKKQGKQLSFFTNESFFKTTQNIEKEHFKNNFKYYFDEIYIAFHAAHQNILKQWQSYAPNSNSTKAKDLNDRIQKFIREKYPEKTSIDSYGIVTLKISSDFRCVFKKIDDKGRPKFLQTARAIERFSQYRREDNMLDVPYIVIGYQLNSDYQEILKVLAVKPYINDMNGRLGIDWSVDFEDYIETSSKLTIRPKDVFEESQIKEEIREILPKLKWKNK